MGSLVLAQGSEGEGGLEDTVVFLMIFSLIRVALPYFFNKKFTYLVGSGIEFASFRAYFLFFHYAVLSVINLGPLKYPKSIFPFLNFFYAIPTGLLFMNLLR